MCLAHFSLHSFLLCQLLTYFIYDFKNVRGKYEFPMTYIFSFGWLEIFSNIGCLNIHGTHVTANNSTINNVVSSFISDLKVVYYYNYQNSITML